MKPEGEIVRQGASCSIAQHQVFLMFQTRYISQNQFESLKGDKTPKPEFTLSVISGQPKLPSICGFHRELEEGWFFQINQQKLGLIFVSKKPTKKAHFDHY